MVSATGSKKISSIKGATTPAGFGIRRAIERPQLIKKAEFLNE
jgi:hypothetical protein